MFIDGYHPLAGRIPVLVDRFGNAVIFQGPEHFMTHEGYHFILSHYFADVDNGNSARILFTTGDKYLHCFFYASATAGFILDVQESPGYTYNASNIITPISRNRITDKDHSLVNACHTPSGSGAGTIISNYFPVGSGGNANASNPGVNRDTNEYLLAMNTKYLITCQSLSDNNKINMGIDFYLRPIFS